MPSTPTHITSNQAVVWWSKNLPKVTRKNACHLKEFQRATTLSGICQDFNKYDFYAAADYLRRHEKNQGFRPANDTQASTNIRAGIVERDMLDDLALLFARVKQSDTPAKHVTATALKRVGPDLEIWIAKNDGPKDEDEKFRSNLADWLNRKEYSKWNSDEALMASSIKHFWRDRLNHYAGSVRSL